MISSADQNINFIVNGDHSDIYYVDGHAFTKINLERLKRKSSSKNSINNQVNKYIPDTGGVSENFDIFSRTYCDTLFKMESYPQTTLILSAGTRKELGRDAPV
uniref:Uncharacterized protein n=1 Tax=Rhizophagus irregularis (strain DAOM 181602 / DAOM 197198 / MUCL 43194) TaxID=747089 RepID=U9UNH1_RHIID